MELALSTSVCAATTPERVLTAWRELAGAHATELGLAVHAALPPAQQLELVSLARAAGVAVRALSFSRLGPDARRAAPRWIGDDRDERLACEGQLVAAIERVADHGVPFAVLEPAALPLSPTISALEHAFAEARPLPWREVLEQRREQIEAVLDRLLSTLDRVVSAADRHGLSVLLPDPAPWPHLVPGPDDVARVLAELSGAPLRALHCTDWWAVARALGWFDAPPRETSVVRLADAAGLTVALPLGTGESAESATSQTTADLGLLTFVAGTTAEEVARSVHLARAGHQTSSND